MCMSPWAGRHIEDGWESFEHIKQHFRSLDFGRIEPSGKFYYLEGLRDDFRSDVQPQMYFDFSIDVSRVIEVIAAILEFAQTLWWFGKRKHVVVFVSVEGLSGRRTTIWSHRALPPAAQGEIITRVTMPVATAPSAIGPHVATAVQPVMRLFGVPALPPRS